MREPFEHDKQQHGKSPEPEALKEDIRRLMHNLNDLKGEAKERFFKESSDLFSELKTMGEQAGVAFRQVGCKAKESVTQGGEHFVETVSGYVKENPMTAALICLSTVMLFSRLFRR